MQKPRRLTDENSVSFQMFLILLSFIALGSDNQISVFKHCQSNTKQYSVFKHCQKKKEVEKLWPQPRDNDTRNITEREDKDDNERKRRKRR